MTRLKYDYEMLKNICDDGGVTLLIDYKDKYITRDSRIIGKCVLCENSFDAFLQAFSMTLRFADSKGISLLFLNTLAFLYLQLFYHLDL